jgi:hypothetical protein
MFIVAGPAIQGLANMPVSGMKNAHRLLDQLSVIVAVLRSAWALQM